MAGTVQTGTVLDRILATKAEEVAARRTRRPLAELASQAAAADPCRGFRDALARKIAAGLPGVISEIKKASPSKGVIRADFDPVSIARSYERAGAACLSVLTDEVYFQGHDDYLVAARAATRLPVLRKDFVIDPYQLTEARALGADCVLLIVAALSPGNLRDLYREALRLGLDVLVEVHDEAELEQALALEASLIGINNRNLKTFETSLDTSYRLRALVPEDVLLVTESGIHTPDQVAALRARGLQAFLVGEAFMREPDPGAAFRALFG